MIVIVLMVGHVHVAASMRMTMTVMAVPMPLSDECPDEECDAGEDEDGTDNMCLLGLKGAPELETHERDDAGDRNRSNDMANRGEETVPRRVSQGPALCARDNGKRH